MERRLLDLKDIKYYDVNGFCHSVMYDFAHGIYPTPQFNNHQVVLELWNKLMQQAEVSKEILND
jgi:hypothetical protein